MSTQSINLPDELIELSIMELIKFRSIDPITECWNYTGPNNGNGYGCIYIDKKKYFTHRLSAHLFLGLDLQSGKFALHKCDNKKCFNPDHLFTGDQYDNMKDCFIKKKFYAQSITHCPKGHEYNEENTRMYRGRRNCRACQDICNAKYRELRLKQKQIQEI